MAGADAEGEAGAVGCPVQEGEGRGAKLDGQFLPFQVEGRTDGTVKLNSHGEHNEAWRT